MSQPVVVLIDDVRSFSDGRACEVARTSAEALTLLHRLLDADVDELWLDYDLGGDDTVMPVVDWLVTVADRGAAFPVRRVIVHSVNVGGGHRVTTRLQHAGYPVERHYNARCWTW